MLSDTSLKLISEWKPVSEQPVGGGQNFSSKKLKAGKTAAFHFLSKWSYQDQMYSSILQN